jgi:CubicO group peptidase (beta-lactamase class C family)
VILKGCPLDGVRVFKQETVDLMLQNHLNGPRQKYGLGGAVDGERGYAWAGAYRTRFGIDRKNMLLAAFMVQTPGLWVVGLQQLPPPGARSDLILK